MKIFKEKGQGTVEIALVVALIAIVSIIGLNVLGNKVVNIFDQNTEMIPPKEYGAYEPDSEALRAEKALFVQNMGSGINLGNALDSTNLWDYTPDANELEYETFWGNPQIDKEQLKTIREAGFKTVRIPITWEDHMNENGDISKIWLDRVQTVVDMALAEDLYVIINTHHETWLDLDTSRETEITTKYAHVWTQIAKRFKKYDDHLLFEGMNEPRLRGSAVEWKDGTPEMRTMINNLNAIFVKTIRTIEENERRYLLIGGYATHTTQTILDDLKIPDGRIIVTVHAYTPYKFAQKTDGTAVWSDIDPTDTEPITTIFTRLNQRFIQNGVPVILTEFGCIDKNNLSDRTKWTKFHIDTAKANTVSCIWWDNGSTFQLLDRDNNTWTFPEIVTELTK